MKNIQINRNTNRKDLKLLEVLFFSYFIYSNTSEILHVYVPYLGSALLGLSAIIAFSIFIKKSFKSETQVILLVVATATIFLLIQLIVHGVSLLAKYNSPFLMWPILTITMVVLSRKPNFIIRLVVAMFFISIIRRFIPTILDLTSTSPDLLNLSAEIERVNSIAGWNAFCSLALWLIGWKTKDKLQRILYWGLALLALFLMMEMTSRGALLAFSIGMILGLRGIPRKNWLRIILGISSVVLILSSFTFFNTYIQNYQNRMLEQSGREDLWRGSLVLMRAQPILGYGTDLIGGSGDIYSPTLRIYRAPHNPFILIELSSGIFPLIPFSVMWILAIMKSIRLGNKNRFLVDALPLISCAFTYSFMSNVSFMNLWVIACTAYCFQLSNLSLLTTKPSPNYSYIGGKGKLDLGERVGKHA